MAGLMVMAGMAHAATWHVSPAGSDANPGTEDQPFATIARVVDAVAPGDTVIIHAGVYPEAVVMKTSGEPDRPIVFQGERGPDGEWLTLLDTGRAVEGWEPAPEVGEGVYKTIALDFAPFSMTLDGKQLARIRDDYMTGEEGMKLLATPATETVTGSYLIEGLCFWDGLEVLYGQRDGTTWIRFRNGDDPTGMNLKAAPDGGGIQLKDISYVTVRDLAVRNARDCVVIEGAGAQYNVIERCDLANGHNRVVVGSGASHNIVRENEMTPNYYGYADPGAWGADKPTKHTSIRMRIYGIFKYIVGFNASDDHGVLMRGGGEDNEVCYNHIYGGLIGISCGDS
ncbi:MAG TPA: hypothetical protein VM283_09085, partial [Armatimonadota bacterium]|nr:hypothetical protein [Armatimonadota bacterium]